MTAAFPDAELATSRTCDPKDRRLAAAVRANAGAIVTFNTSDFPNHSVEPFALEVVHPDTFLLDLLDSHLGWSSENSLDRRRPTGEPRRRCRRSSTYSIEPGCRPSPTRSDAEQRDRPAVRAETVDALARTLPGTTELPWVTTGPHSSLGWRSQAWPFSIGSARRQDRADCRPRPRSAAGSASRFG
jgi:hypothetical protein